MARHSGSIGHLHCVGFTRGFGRIVAGQLEHLGDVLHELVADLLGACVVFEIIIASRQAEPALTDANRHVGRVLEIAI
mgnify:CR=1 FL=1